MLPTRLFRTAGFRLAALYAGLFGLSVLLLVAAIYWIVSDALRSQLAATIDTETAALIGDYRTEGLAHTAENIAKRLSAGVGTTSFYLLLDPGGNKIAGNLPPRSLSPGWQSLSLPVAAERQPADDAADSIEHPVTALVTALPDGALLMVAQDAYRIVEVEEAIVRAFGWAFAATVLLAALGGIALSFGFLRQIDAINRTTRAIMAGRMTDRVPTRGTGDELDSLAINLNEMLDRVQNLMESLRQVSNDIAHDLRTPLSRLRQRLERVREEAERPADYEAAVDAAIADTDTILKTFAALLRIAQIEAGTRQAAFTAVDLSAIFRSIAGAYAAVAEDRGQRFSAAIDPDVHVNGDRELLTQMLANLVENAIRHTPTGSHVRLSLERRTQGPLGIVADDGPGIPEEAREKVFRRFFRLERSRSTAGSGLGLALVGAVAELHGIAVSLSDAGPGLQVSLDFMAEQAA